MKSWQTMSGPWASVSGLIIEPIGTEEGLRDMGRTLRNGLMVQQGHALYAGLCVDAKRQIFAVRDSQGVLVANGELKVHNGDLRLMFVRGANNVEFRRGDAAYDAAADYVSKVNARDPAIVLSMEPSQGGFAAAQGPAEEDAWKRALRLAAEVGTSPFAALVQGFTVPADPRLQDDGTIFVDTTWQPLSLAFIGPSGVVIEPVSSRSGLRTLGVELENNLILDGITASTARRCVDGSRQFCAIHTEADGIIGYAELAVRDGQVVTLSARGHAEEPLPAEVTQSLEAYLVAVNSDSIALVASPASRSGFTQPGIDAPDLQEWEGDDSSLPIAQREGADLYEGHMGDHWHDDDDEDDDDTNVYEDNASWSPMSDPFTAANGLVVEPVGSQATLRSMGEELRNSLATHSESWARRCADGDIQIVRILDGDGGRLIANAELVVRNGALMANFNRGEGSSAASPAAEEALAEFCHDVNSGHIELNVKLDDDYFDLDWQPSPRP